MFIALVIVVMTMGGVEAKTPNPYRILGVARDANEEQIKKAFKKRSLKFHPDRSQDPRAKEKFEMVVNAY
jgi:DnaJ-class molecular chaperone